MGFVFWKWDEHVCPGHCWSISPLRHRWVNLRSTLNDRECQWTTTMTGDGWNLTTKMVMGMVYWVSHITLICSRSFGLQNISNIQVWIWIRPTTTNHFLNGFNGNRPWFNPHHSIQVSGRRCRPLARTSTVSTGWMLLCAKARRVLEVEPGTAQKMWKIHAKKTWLNRNLVLCIYIYKQQIFIHRWVV